MAFAKFTLCLLVPSVFSQTFRFPNNSTLKEWNHLLETKLYELAASVTHVEVAHKSYNADPDAKVHKVSGEAILRDVLEKMTELLERKRRALRRLVDTAERNVIYLDQTYDKMLAIGDVPFFNMKDPPKDVELPFSPRLRQRVSFDDSGVHIPLEILDGYPEILNGINWTMSLDEVFKQNWAEDPTLHWQSFGSVHGYMRVYPAFRWPDHPYLPDLFDVRRRPWYVQSSMSPKDMIILMDRSGSVHGQTLDIMKITVRALLNSLGENDYVNVAWFNNRVKWVVPCFHTLVQATAQNRRLLSDAVERLSESNLTSYTAALDFAFEAFRKFDKERKPWSGSYCHKVIMFLSDGGTDWPEELVTQHCNQSRSSRIKIFTFACGPHPIPTVVLKKMACATGGYFSPITALGSVRVKVQDYVRVLSRPLAEANSRDLFQWHNFYRDVGGLGMMTTVTLPVYCREDNGTTNRLLGVMGIDIPVGEMTALYPAHDLGTLGYPFSVNTNGFVVFHPRLRDHIVYIGDPPDVDLTDLEGTSREIFEMRRAMINGLQGHLLKYLTLVPVGQGHAISTHMDYFYGAVEPSTFRFGVAVQSNGVKIKIKARDVMEATKFLEELHGLLVAPWKYCNNGEFEEALSPHQLAERIRSNYSTCDEELVQHLLWDVPRALTLQLSWRSATFPNVYSLFWMSGGGLTMVHPAEEAEDYMRQRDPLRNNLYKWASHVPGCVFSVADGHSHELTVACRVVYAGKAVAGVIGVEMEQSVVQKIFESVTYEGSDSCKDMFAFHCFLLNDGGIIVASNQPHIRPGEFIGERDPQVLHSLLKGGMLGRMHRFNYQSWCSKEGYTPQTLAAAVPRFSIVNSICQALLSLNFSFCWDYLVYILTSINLWGAASAGEAHSDANNHSCVTKSFWFYHTGKPNQHRTFTCSWGDSDCERQIQAAFLPNVTLISVIASTPCDCDDPIPLQSVTPQDVGPDHCEIKEPYRKRPEFCFRDTAETNETDCGAGSGSSSSSKTLLLRQLLFYLLSFIILSSN